MTRGRRWAYSIFWRGFSDTFTKGINESLDGDSIQTFFGPLLPCDVHVMFMAGRFDARLWTGSALDVECDGQQ